MRLPAEKPECPLTPGPSPQGEGGFYAVPARLPGERGVFKQFLNFRVAEFAKMQIVVLNSGESSYVLLESFGLTDCYAASRSGGALSFPELAAAV